MVTRQISPHGHSPGDSVGCRDTCETKLSLVEDENPLADFPLLEQGI